MKNDGERNEKKPKKPLLWTIGWGLLLFAVICWIIVAVAIFLPFSLAIKAGIISVCLIIGEIFFWIGAVFVGKEVVTKYRSYLNPKNWFKKEKKQKDES